MDIRLWVGSSDGLVGLRLLLLGLDSPFGFPFFFLSLNFFNAHLTQ